MSPQLLALSMTKTTKHIIDILIVADVSLLAFLIEGYAITQEWVTIDEEARGASAVIIAALVAVGLVFARGGNFADLGFKRPKRWSKLFVQVFIILIIFLAAQTLVPLLVSLFLTLPPDWSRYDSINGNLSAAIVLALLLPLVAALPEEIIYRGFLMGRLSDIFARSFAGSSMTVLISAFAFAAVHFTWGIGGVVFGFIMGVIWGTAYILCGRNLWVVIFAHSGGHILFVIYLYLGLAK